MKAEKMKLKVLLVDAMQKWLDDGIGSGLTDKIEIVYGNDTATHMANAAFAVFDGIIDAQKTGIEEGYFSTPEDND